MDHRWWSDLDEAILGCFTTDRALAPAEIGRKLGISEAGVVSLLGMLAREGKIRIALVELSEAARRDRLDAGVRRSDAGRLGGVVGADPEPTFARGQQAAGRESPLNASAESDWKRHANPNPVP